MDARRESRCLSIREVAAELGISRTTAWELVKEGQLPAVRITPRCLRVAREDLERFIQSHREEAHR